MIFVQLRGTYYFVIMGLEHFLVHYHELFESFRHNSIMLKKSSLESSLSQISNSFMRYLVHEKQSSVII